MAANKKQHTLADMVRGGGKGPFSGQEVAATRPSFGHNDVYGGFARSGGEHRQPGATPEAIRSGSVK